MRLTCSEFGALGIAFGAEQNLISATVNNSPIPYSDLTVTSNVNTAVATYFFMSHSIN